MGSFGLVISRSGLGVEVRNERASEVQAEINCLQKVSLMPCSEVKDMVEATFGRQ